MSKLLFLESLDDLLLFKDIYPPSGANGGRSMRSSWSSSSSPRGLALRVFLVRVSPKPGEFKSSYPYAMVCNLTLSEKFRPKSGCGYVFFYLILGLLFNIYTAFLNFNYNMKYFDQITFILPI